MRMKTVEYLRLEQVIGTNRLHRKRVTPPKSVRERVTESPRYPGILPVGKSSFYAGIANGKYPAPIKLGPRTSVWLRADIEAVAERAAHNSQK